MIYAEYLFAENFITGAIIIHLTGKLCGTIPKVRWMVLGASACGLFSFILNLSIPPAFALIIKLGFSAVLVMVTYHPKKVKAFFKLLCIFYVVSFIMGGVTIGLMYFIGAEGVANNTFVYLNHISYINIVAGVVLTYILVSRLARFIKDRIYGAHHQVEATICVGDKVATINGIIDTGNYLREPLSNLPVFIMSASVAKKLEGATMVEHCIELQSKSNNINFKEDFYKEEFTKGYRLIPYKGVGANNGNLIGFKPECIIIKEDSVERKMSRIYLAIDGDSFFKQGDESCSLLLHRDILDKGIGCYG